MALQVAALVLPAQQALVLLVALLVAQQVVAWVKTLYQLVAALPEEVVEGVGRPGEVDRLEEVAVHRPADIPAVLAA